MNVRLFAIFGLRFLHSDIEGKLQTCGSAFHCRRQTHGVLLQHTSADIKGQHLRCTPAQPQNFSVSGPWDMGGKMGLICSGSTHQTFRFPLSGKQFPCCHTDTMENFKKEEMTVSQVVAGSKEVYTLQGKVEQFLKSTRRKTISVKISKDCLINFCSVLSALSASPADGTVWS